MNRYFDYEIENEMAIWDEVMIDFFPNAKTEEDIENELDDIWNG